MPHDPLMLSKRRTRAVFCGCGLAAAAALAWALLPPPSVDRQTVTGVGPPPQQPEVTPAPLLNIAAFQRPVWPAPPPKTEVAKAPPTPAPPPAPPPLRLELLGIIGSPGAYKAVIFDPELNRACVVAPGGSLADHDVEDVAVNTVMLRGRSGSRSLALKAGRPSP
jgi:hypothetical protein